MRGRRTNTSNDTSLNAPHPLDAALGVRIRLRRRELKLSQGQLARQVGITFQQVQKYERGTNRVSFSRLFEIARALQCNIGDIIGDLDQSKATLGFVPYIARLSPPGAADLLACYTAIQSPKYRRAILGLAKQLADGRLAQLAE